MKSGLEKLEEAKVSVDKLSREANEKKKKLAIAQDDAQKSMVKIQESMEIKASRKAEVEQLQATVTQD